MDREKLKNWWWYHRVHVLIAAGVAALVLYSVLPGLLAPKPDAVFAVVGTTPWPEESSAALITRLEQLLGDRNGDGTVLIELHKYRVDFSGETPGSVQYNEAAALDADLVGSVSAALFLEDPAGFMANVAVEFAEPVPCRELQPLSDLPFPAELALAVRADADTEALQALLEQGLRTDYREKSNPSA